MTTKKTKTPTIWKPFRLMDFEIVDEYNDDNENNEESSEDEDKKQQVFNSDDDDDNNTHHKKEKPTKQPKKVSIQLYGLNEKGETICLTVPDYTPSFHILVGDDWTTHTGEGLLQELKKKITPYYAAGILDFTLEQKKDLYKFNAGHKQTFMKIRFNNMATFNRVKNLWFAAYQQQNPAVKEGNSGSDPQQQSRRQAVAFPYSYKINGVKKTIQLKLYESNIPPLLKFFHQYNINPSGWISIPINRLRKPDEKKTTCHYEFTCSVSQIKPDTTRETGVPYKICSFDIEASSSHGDFPIPQKTYKRLAIQMVDLFTIHQKNTQSVALLQKLLKKMILTAFGFATFQGIDRVYPKKTPKTAAKMETNIQTFLQDNETDDDDTTNNNKNNIQSILAIENYFNQKQKEMNAVVAEDEEAVEEDVEESTTTSTQNPTQISTPTQTTCSIKAGVCEEGVGGILSVLKNGEFTREIKINRMNGLLMKHFPPLEGDRITFIGTTFVRQGETQPYRNHCLVLGDCSAVDKVEIQCCATERELMLAWRDLMQQENPDIVIGYNIFGFDYEFMFCRAVENDCVAEFLQLSREIGHVSANKPFKGFGGGGGGVESEDGSDDGGGGGNPEGWKLECKKITIASGPFDMKFPNMKGRFQIDLYTYFRREFNLPSYKLDDVSAEQICDKITKIELHPELGETGQTWLYSRNLKGLNCRDFIHLEQKEYTSEAIENGRKFQVVNIVENRIICVEGLLQGLCIEENKVLQWGLAKDDVSPHDIFRLSNGTADERAIVAKYCIQDCNIVQQLLMKIDILTGYNEMARICCVPMKFLVLRGQGIKLTSCMAKYCLGRETLMPDLTAEEEDADVNHDYEGAIVLPPKCGMYIDEPVACVDYSSLYPTIIIANNLSQDSKIWMKEYDAAGLLLREQTTNACYDNLPEYDYFNIEYENYAKIKNKKVLTGKTICRWSQARDGQKGIIPSILEDILKARKTTRKQAELETDDFMKNILDKRQLAYKITANSIYGQCGSRTSTFYDKDIAACTTATGRKMIIYAKTMVETLYGDHQYQHPKYGNISTSAEYIYGDTDSVFMTFNIRQQPENTKIVGKEALEITIELAKEVARYCSIHLKKPMELTYEKTLMPFIILSKKRYVGMLYENDTEHCKLKFMGLSLKRRDCCNYLKDVYGGVLNQFLYSTEKLAKNTDPKQTTKLQQDVASAIQSLQYCLTELIEGRVSMEKLMITKSLRDYYKKPQQIAHSVLAKRIGERDPGNKPKSGDRMKYVFIETKASAGQLQGDRIETPEYILQNGLRVDYHHYITNQLMKPLLQLFGLVVEEILKIQGKRQDLLKYQASLSKIKRECLGGGKLGDDMETMEVYTKHKEKLDAGYARMLLFEPFLQKIHNDKHKIQTLQQFWGKRGK